MVEREKISVLLVDDNEMNRDMLSRRLKRKGYDVTTAKDGYIALEYLNRGSFDLVLLDIAMPKINGLEVLKTARKTFTSTELPIVMVSGCDENKKIVLALELGANDYITKPINFSVALARIQSQITHKKLTTKKIEIPTVIEVGKPFKHYFIESKIGQGGMGIVYKARDTRLERTVAIKVISCEQEEMSHVKRFEREARAIAQINHPNIISIYEVSSASLNYFVMEYIEGTTLKSYIAAKTVTPAIAVTITKKLASALHAVHKRGIIHRDVKSTNIMIDKKGKPWLMDFGLAKSTDTNGVTRDGEIIGTPSYMSPEQVDPKWGTVDERSDVYSLGAIFYEMLTGKPPVKGANLVQIFWEILQKPVEKPSDFSPNIPAEVDQVCLKALAKRKEERYLNAKEFELALGQLAVSQHLYPTKRRSIEDYNHDLQKTLIFDNKTKETISTIIDVLDDGNSDIRQTVLDVFGQDESRASKNLFPTRRRIEKLKPTDKSTLASNNKEAVSILCDALEGDNADIKQIVLGSLGKMGLMAAEAVPDIIKVLKEDPKIWLAAAQTLEQIGPIAVAELIKELESSEDPYVIVKVLTKMGSKIVPILTNAFRSHKGKIRSFIAMTLGGMKADAITAAPVLIETLEDKDSQVFIVKALGKMGRDIIPLLVDALQYEKVSTFIIEVLNIIGSEAVIPLIEALEEEEIRPIAIKALLAFGDEAIPLLVKALNNKKIYFVVQKILTEIGPGTIPELLSAIPNANSYEINFMVINIIGNMGPKAAPELIKSLKNEETRTLATHLLINLKEQAVPALTKSLRGEDKQVCFLIKEILGNIKPNNISFT